MSMSLLITGLALFMAVHLIPKAPRLRLALVGRLGAKPYRGAFSAVALLALAVVVWGFSRSPVEQVYAPPAWGHPVSMILTPIALVLFAAANMPTRIRALVRHPMLLGLLLWAFAHLLANGEIRSLVLFGGFAAFAAVEIASAAARGKGPPKEPPPRIAMDIAAVVVGAIAAGLLAGFHGVLFGAPVL
ncbi:MAG: NnrU family protein [Rhodospirillaceae bacterium]|nr:NnrU family protein [Rhodospirillaceae bacterium]MYJ70812.1 NnrU family protein [Rhodospirillaceae bacterium]